MPIQLLIAEDHPWVRRGLRATFERTDIDVVGEATKGVEAVELASNTDADVMLLDIKLPNLDGFEVMRKLKSERPNLPVVIYTHHERQDFMNRAPELGAYGYLNKRSDGDALIDAVRRASRGDKMWSEDTANV